MKTQNKIHDDSKCLEQVDDPDNGGTCTRHKRLCSGGEQGAMITIHGKEKNERMILWIGWGQWFGWKEWTCSNLRSKVGMGLVGERKDLQEMTKMRVLTSITSTIKMVRRNP